MGKIPTNSLGKSSELKLHCFCLYNAYSMPKDIYSEHDFSLLLQTSMRLHEWRNLSKFTVIEVVSTNCVYHGNEII